MITIPTTLILGAGASKPYGFPTGNELRVELQTPDKLQELVTVCGYPQQCIDDFCGTFRQSQMFSIDAFLARRANHQLQSDSKVTYGEIGKAAIALCLIRREKPENLLAEREDHWYRYLWNVIGTSLEDFANNKLRVVTFNYDRSLEFFLLTVMQHAFGISVSEAATHVSKLPILHVYGQLGELPELSEHDNALNYWPKTTADRIRTAALGIRVIDENRDDDEVFSRAFEFMQESTRVCFLGFGFDETNVRRLRISNLTLRPQHDASVSFEPYPTTLGMEQAERQRVENLLVTRAGTIPVNFEFVRNVIQHNTTCQCERFLRATGALYNPS